MSNKKYSLAPHPSGLYRIQALVDLPASGGLPLVKAGDLGGLISSEDSLDSDPGTSSWV